MGKQFFLHPIMQLQPPGFDIDDGPDRKNPQASERSPRYSSTNAIELRSQRVGHIFDQIEGGCRHIAVGEYLPFDELCGVLSRA